MKAKRGRRRKQILDDVTSTRSSWKLKEEEPDRTMWREYGMNENNSLVQ